MKGEFRNALTKYIFSLLFMLTGTFIAVRCILWGIDELQADHGFSASAICCFTLAGCGLLSGFLSILIFRFNRGAFLTIENGRIDARSGWNDEVHINMSDVTKVELQGKSLKLFTAGRVVWIYNLNHAKEVCEYISSQIVRTDVVVDRKEVEEEYRKSKRSSILYSTAAGIVGAFMFLNIAWCVLLTGGKDLDDFSKSDNLIFIVFIFVETFTVALTFFLVRICGRKLEAFRLSKFHILSALASEYKYDALDRYPNRIGEKFLYAYIYRIIIFSPEENIFAYMLERFDLKARSWVGCYEYARGFDMLSELYDDLGNSFADVILED